LTILTRNQVALAYCENSCVGDTFGELPATGEFACHFNKLALMPGRYRLAIRCRIGSRAVCSIPNAGEFQVVEGSFYATGNLPPSGSGSSLLEYRWSVGEADAGP
jgi:hypothetical protein